MITQYLRKIDYQMGLSFVYSLPSLNHSIVFLLLFFNAVGNNKSPRYRWPESLSYLGIIDNPVAVDGRFGRDAALLDCKRPRQLFRKESFQGSELLVTVRTKWVNDCCGSRTL